MLTYTGRRNLYGKLTNNAEAANLTTGDTVMNLSDKRILSMEGGDWWFLEETTTVSTVASQSAYQLPNPIRKVVDLYITDGTTIYTPIPVENAAHWSRILQAQLGDSDRALYYRRIGNTVEIQPAPAASSNTITVTYRKKQKDLSAADYTTGTVAVNDGATGVVGTGTTFTAGMVGRYIRFDDGDYDWYQIASFTDATNIDLTKNYAGGSNVSGSSFTIGEISCIPEQYQEAPVYRSAAIYWGMQGDINRSREFWTMYDGGYEKAMSPERRGVIGDMLEEAGEKVEGKYNDGIANLGHIDPNIPPEFIATSNFS